MCTVTTSDGTQIFYKDWGKGQPIVFSHGWPLSSDDWDAQMMFFLNHGYRVITHDRRGHGRSSQVGEGHDMDHYADDLAAVTAHLDLKNAIHVGHSTGGGEVAHYVARHGESRVGKAVLISAVPPIMVKTPKNPGGTTEELYSTNFKRSSLLIGRNSIWISQADRSTVTTCRCNGAEGTIRNWCAPRHDGRSESTLRRHCRFFPDGLYGRPQENLGSYSGYARR